MFAPSYFGQTYWADHYYGIGSDPAPERGLFWGSLYFGGPYWGITYFPGGIPSIMPPAPARAVIVDIADAVTEALNAATFAVTVAGERMYVPVHQLEDLADCKLTVVPVSVDDTQITRGGARQTDYVIDVGVQQKKPPTNEEFDPLMLVAERVGTLFAGKRLPGYPSAFCSAADNRPIFVPAHADNERVFTSVVSLTFRVLS